MFWGKRIFHSRRIVYEKIKKKKMFAWFFFSLLKPFTSHVFLIHLLTIIISYLGLIMEPEKRYSQVVKRSFHISMAALVPNSSDNQPIQVMCGIEERNYLLCTLQKDKALQVALDLNFEVLMLKIDWI